MSFSAFPFSVDVPVPAIFEIGGLSEDRQPEWLSSWRKDFPEWIVLPHPDFAGRPDWFADIDAVLTALARPVIALCRGKACADLIAWIASRPTRAMSHIEGALLVAPSLPPEEGFLRSLTGQEKPGILFPSVVIGSRNSGGASYEVMQRAARDWGSRLVDGGDIGDSAEPARLGAWAHGRHVLDWLVEQVAERQALRLACGPAVGLHANKSNPNKF